MNLIPYSRYARTVLICEKRPFLREFLDEPDTPLDIRVAPGVGGGGLKGNTCCIPVGLPHQVQVRPPSPVLCGAACMPWQNEQRCVPPSAGVNFFGIHFLNHALTERCMGEAWKGGQDGRTYSYGTSGFFFTQPPPPPMAIFPPKLLLFLFFLCLSQYGQIMADFLHSDKNWWRHLRMMKTWLYVGFRINATVTLLLSLLWFEWSVLHRGPWCGGKIM